jgi:Zn-dependent M32 family carboxypeptidase
METVLMNVQAINKITGEVAEFEVINLPTLMDAYSAAMEYEKVATRLKDQLKKELPKYLDETGKSEVIGNKQFKTNAIQRKTYDKAVLRKVLDEDTFDVLMKPDKTAIDKLLKEEVKRGGAIADVSTEIRNSMIPDGRPYSVTKLEKLDRDARA